MAKTPAVDLTSSGIAFVGFGEAAQAILSGWRQQQEGIRPAAFDIKTNSVDDVVRDAKRADYAASLVDGYDRLEDALTGSAVVFSLVTADRALEAASAAATCIAPGSYYLDCNSCSPGTKKRAAEVVAHAGGRYVDVAIMAPVHPKLHRTPMLAAGPDAEAAVAFMNGLGMDVSRLDGPVGAASANKMTRSIMIKGLEALVLECLLTGRANGVEEAVLDSLEASFPGFGWRQRAAYMMERVMTHGIRRAAEMREVAATVDDAGLSGDMARATVEWQQRVGELGLNAADIGTDHASLADALLAALAAGQSNLRAAE